MQINNIGQLFAELRVPIPAHKPSVPTPVVTPPPEKNKVVADPTRVPVNKQAALIVRPNRDWLAQPPPMPPEKPKNPYLEELKEAYAKLRIERNAHAHTKDELGAARQIIRALRDTLKARDQALEVLESEIKGLNDTIRQLEDLKL